MKILDSIERLREGLDYHMARHNLLTANLAHVDTPGYKALDLERRQGFDRALSTAMEATDPRHFGQQAQSAGGGGAWKVVKDPGATVGHDGNGVSVDREAVKIAANTIRYDAVASLAGSEIADLMWAANDGRTG